MTINISRQNQIHRWVLVPSVSLKCSEEKYNRKKTSQIIISGKEVRTQF